ncbi:hypothetical protein [Nitrosophilus kaiyonis]|uniref:hypothetical protein n=1 Tax=Nitrosophilus kaiyonis TaxID=2930200 RepID=UPI00248FC9AD|nr:hypothetical protein [Nitrosophilus kaiyonis]
MAEYDDIKKSCELANDYKQIAICNEKEIKLDQNYFYIDISSKFKIAFLKKDLEKFTKYYLVSPFLILYHFYLKEKNDKALYIFNQKDFITFTIFKENSLIFGKHIKKDENFAFDQFVIDSIKEFYENECCYFIEDIKIYDADFIDENILEKLYENILLEIDHEKIEIDKLLDEICKNEKYLGWFYKKEKKKKEFIFPKWLTIAAAVIFSIMILADIYIRFQNSVLEEKMINLQNEKIDLQDKIEELRSETKELKEIIPFAQEIKSKNTLIVSNIKNIFDLVPDEIVLTKAEFTKNSLILMGFTPKKRYFEEFINKALKNFYQKREVKYKKIENGYIFISKKSRVN